MSRFKKKIKNLKEQISSFFKIAHFISDKIFVA